MFGEESVISPLIIVFSYPRQASPEADFLFVKHIEFRAAGVRAVVRPTTVIYKADRIIALLISSKDHPQLEIDNLPCQRF